MKDKAESGGGNSPPIMADGRKRKRLDTELIHDSEGASQLFVSLLLFLLSWSPTCLLQRSWSDMNGRADRAVGNGYKTDQLMKRRRVDEGMSVSMATNQQT